MIKVTRLNGSSLVINADLIEFLEATPETIICLITGKKVMVKETIDDVIERVAEFKGKVGIRRPSPDTAEILERNDHAGQ